MKVLKFKNLDSKSEIIVPLKSDVTYIYGGNGSGKTTFSKEVSRNLGDECIVFNTDFINKNIYIIDSEGAKTDTNTKENFTSLFIGEESVYYNNEIKSLTERLNKNKINIQSAEEQLTNELSKKKLPKNSKLEDCKISHNMFTYNFDFSKSIVKNKELLKFNAFFPTSINTEEELNLKINQYLENNTFTEINRLLNNDENLKKLFNDNSNQSLKIINNMIIEYNTNIKKIKEIEIAFSIYSDPNLLKQWIIQGLILHEHSNNCLFCDAKNIDFSIEKWKRITNDTFVKSKNDLMSNLENILKSLNKLLENKELYINFIPEIINTSEEINIHVTKNLQNIKNNIEITPLIVNLKKDKIKVEEENMYNDILNYLLNHNIKDYFFPFIEKDKITEQIKLFNDKLIEENKNVSNSLINIVKKIAKKLGLEKELDIVTDTKGKIPKISLIAGNDKKNGIKILSEGQRHKLALIVFFAKIELSKKKYKYIVLDDPMLSLDIITYHKLRNYIFSNLSSKSEKFIMLTHNFYFLIFMLSNLYIDKNFKEITTLLNLNPDNCSEIDLDLIAKDDILLFKDSIYRSETIDDISLWYWMIIKIARLFLDIKIKTLGVLSFENPKEDLLKVFREDSPEFKESKKLMDLIKKISNSPSIEVKEIKLGLKYLNNFLELLNFKVIFDQNEIDSIFPKNKYKDEDKVVESPVAKDFHFKILKEAHSIIFDENVDINIKNYIRHPRHQITQSLIAFAAQKDI